jgi:hypothetical protein
LFERTEERALLEKLTTLRLVEDEAIFDGAKAAAEPIRVARVMVSFMVF